MTGIDDVDRRLIAILQHDARVTNVELARQVGLTEGAVRRRLDNLFRTQALRIIGVGDPKMLGLTTHAVVGIKVEPKLLEQVLDTLAAMPEISFVYHTLGQFDILIVAYLPANEGLGQFLTSVVAQVEGVRETETFLILNTRKRAFLFGAESNG